MFPAEAEVLGVAEVADESVEGWYAGSSRKSRSSMSIDLRGTMSTLTFSGKSPIVGRRPILDRGA